MSKAYVFAIMPEERRERFTTCGNAQTQTSWIVGDDTNDQIADLQAQKQLAIAGKLSLPLEEMEKLHKTGVMDVYAAVGELVGKSLRTISSWANVASKADKQQRKTYHVLPFSHFEFAYRFERDTEQAEKILAVAKRQIENNGGRPPSVEWLEANFASTNPQTALHAITMAQDSQDEYNEQVCNVFAADTTMPQVMPANEFVIYQQLSKTLTLLEQLTMGVKDNILRDIILSAVKTMKLALVTKAGIDKLS